MKAGFKKSADISIRQITIEDWEVYREYWKGLSDPAHFSGIMNGRDLDDPQTYQDLFEAIGSSNVMFGLFDKNRMIGQTGIFYKQENGKTIATFQGSEIADEYRGFGFSKNLYEARMNYLHQTKYEGRILTAIRPDNKCSLQAAENNSFRRTDVTIHDKIVLERQGVDLQMG